MELANQNLSAYFIIGSLVVLLLGSLLYGIYAAFGAGSVELTDQIEEHAKLHKFGIAHSHKGNGRAVCRPRGRTRSLKSRHRSSLNCLAPAPQIDHHDRSIWMIGNNQFGREADLPSPDPT